MEKISFNNKEDDLEKSKIKEGIDFVFEQNPELAKIGNREQYSDYLDTIFPESKIKDIVYHGSERKNIEEYSSAYSRGKESGNKFIYFSKNREVVKGYLDTEDPENKNNKGKIYYNLINFNNPIEIDFKNATWRGREREIQIVWARNASVDFEVRFNSIEEGQKYLERWLNENNIKEPERSYYSIENTIGKKIIKDVFEIEEEIFERRDVDGLILNNIRDVMTGDDIISTHYAVRENNQVHILGSNQDIEGFKKFRAEK